jgi:ATP phosphoribosyltransferase
VTGGLTIAIPRGSLFGETLDLLDALGVETGEIRANDRRLVFPGVLTVRPSDVPTYVEHGAADLGITGKDVLMEQADRDVYELADLAYGRCRMIVAAPASDSGSSGPGDPLGERLRRSGVVRIATKYPRVATEHFTATGRQAEIVEVKGSVELAPITGLADAIVDLTATGKTLAENGLVEREAIWESTARLIANPVAHKLKAAEIDRLVARVRELA